jgi:hypothetical protein
MKEIKIGRHTLKMFKEVYHLKCYDAPWHQVYLDTDYPYADMICPDCKNKFPKKILKILKLEYVLRKADLI